MTGRRRTRAAVRRWIVRASVLGLVAAAFAPAGLAGAERAAAAGVIPVEIDPGTQYQTIQGWGTSLAWWAEGTGGWSSEQAKNALADALFSPTAGLGLNVVRYNIGATTPTDRCAAQLRVGGAVPSFEQSPGVYDWSQDPSQRWMLQAALDRGANTVEAIPYSAPDWMTANGCSAGADTAGADNLPSSQYQAYAQYLATVVAHMRNSWGIPVTTVEPFNEAVQSKWSSAGRQQAMNVNTSAQNTIIGDLHAQLAAAGVGDDVAITAPDELGSAGTVSDYASYSSASQSDVAQLNSHDYAGGDGSPLGRLGQQTGKRVWMSEWGAGAQSSQIAAGVVLSQRILKNEREMHPDAWVAWQGVDGVRDGGDINDLWGLVWADISPSGNGQLTFPKRYYVMGNYSEFVRPGSEMIDSDDPNTFTAYDPGSGNLVIVATNPTTASESVQYDLNHFSLAPGAAASAHRTSATEDLASAGNAPVGSNGWLPVTLPAQSVTTYVIPNAKVAGARSSQVVRDGTQVDAFGRTADGSVMTDVSTPGSGWSGWTSLAGDLAGEPAAIRYGGQVQVYGRAPDGSVMTDVRTPGGGWSGWTSLNGRLAGDPVAIEYATPQTGDQVQLFGRTSDGSVTTDVFTPGDGWSGWTSLAGGLAGDPTVIQSGSRLELFGRASSGATMTDVYTPGTGWSGWTSLGGVLTGTPSAVQYGRQVQVYGRGSDGAVWSDVFTPGSGWTGWTTNEGVIIGSPVASPYATTQFGSQMEIFGRASDTSVWSDDFTPGSGWSGWFSVGGKLASDPTVVRYGTQLQVYGRAADGTTWSDVYIPGSGWTGWTSMGGDLLP